MIKVGENMSSVKTLELMKKTFDKYRVRFMVLPCPDKRIDMGLRDILGQPTEKLFEEELRQVKERCIYHFKDVWGCRYIFFQLPHTRKKAVLGPYLSEEVTDAFLLETAGECGASHITAEALRRYFASLPVLREDSPVFVMLHIFADDIWGGEGSYRIEKLFPRYTPAQRTSSPPSADPGEETRWLIENIEQRYHYENMLIRAVETGRTHTIQQLMQGFNNLSFDRRASDPLRNMKNYCVIMNTLLRKAAEKGGVHPYHIDRLSSDFAVRIEGTRVLGEIRGLMEEMFFAYCRSVQEYSTAKYSPHVRKAVLYITASLSSDLGPRELADIIGVNPSYLSKRFSRETGKTMTDYINEKRVKRAEQMLRETALQVQTVSQYCGIQDVNYFTKVFKKYTGLTPTRYRKERRNI